MSSSEETSAANFFRALLTGGLLRNKTIGVDKRTVNNHHIASMGMKSAKKKEKHPLVVKWWHGSGTNTREMETQSG